MVRSLWTAATGMKAQQLNIDTISNNLANVNTTSYKAQRVEFKDLLYETLKKGNTEDGKGTPVNLEVGHGVMPSATTRNFKMGSFQETQNPLDLAIDGYAFFAVASPNGEINYTRDGSFKLSIDDDEGKITTSEGYYVLDDSDNEIVIESGMTDLSIDELGNITAVDEDGETVELGRLKLVKFMNPEGLISEGQNLYSATASSGEPIEVKDDDTDYRILQGYLETSNVQVVEEMVKMITAQRAYEINSKSIQTSDEMMQMANNVRR
ncbi:flagellar basal-body rod protein FlgG [Caldisalinibacter kiritimatiensis]|uniref:Flagellar basal-body rod protein FlgG n=1 Tax=Caldisalinibacter kiritimatiensis TaxID=1304284 RepID=R1CVQ9_9FIRM|nr:flagellar basal-body rod protein FlgG [Caldisalinibacter kiritimatiensis]EOD00724.1 Flagellar basal-body rod protein FlgG [Caldisalinibacter kiritimatiensis]